MARVLVVDDDHLLASLLQEALQDEGYCVRAAGCAAQAHASIVARWPDVMVLDVHLPDVDGWALLDICRQEPSGFELPVVMMAAPRPGRATTAPSVAFLPKPFDLDALTQTVAQLVSCAPPRSPAPELVGPPTHD
jgi:two-component system nitrogen regulation response regulator GlnG